MLTTTGKKKRKERIVDNPIEAVRDLASDFAQSAGSDLVSGMADSAFQQIFGSSHKSSQELTPNQEVNLDEITNERLKREEILSYEKQRASIENNIFSYKDSENLKNQIKQLLNEIKLLSKSTQNLTKEVEMAAMEEMPVNPGKYHLNYLEWIIKMIKSLRERVDESSSWLRVFQSKKKQKQYWSMYKKHGTSFGLSSERSIASQVG